MRQRGAAGGGFDDALEAGFAADDGEAVHDALGDPVGGDLVGDPLVALGVRAGAVRLGFEERARLVGIGGVEDERALDGALAEQVRQAFGSEQRGFGAGEPFGEGLGERFLQQTLGGRGRGLGAAGADRAEEHAAFGTQPRLDFAGVGGRLAGRSLQQLEQAGEGILAPGQVAPGGEGVALEGAGRLDDGVDVQRGRGRDDRGGARAGAAGAARTAAAQREQRDRGGGERERCARGARR